MLRIIGGWGNRDDALRSTAERAQRSLEFMPPQPNEYGPWGVWRPRPNSDYNDLVPVDADDVEAIEQAITTVSERINQGPMRTPGHHIQFAREALGEASPKFCEYSARAGFVDRPEPYNHLMLQIAAGTDEALLSRYIAALVIAWAPDHLGLATRETQRAQQHRPPQAIVGYLTYIRDGITFDNSMLDDDVSVTPADGGVYLRVGGTPENPRLDHIHQVRVGLGYAS